MAKSKMVLVRALSSLGRPGCNMSKGEIREIPESDAKALLKAGLVAPVNKKERANITSNRETR